ncbi:Hypothetical predicted protein [Lecanosticta acicola]|uniref:Alpha-carbonic anhydrase domain-containing protein n=1 Tax=Lecanosticta acicola TaxID=111012 RepID=A0AAI8YW73_9PEZI|nr:Hypothetical predicted protein [Lecanosticta acicola]
MFFQKALGVVAASASLVSACAPELYKRSGHHPNHMVKRQNLPNDIKDSRGWTFELSEEWNVLNPDWGYCFNGTQQSPIAIDSRWGLSTKHQPKLNYPERLLGRYNNWDFGPQWIVDYAANSENATLTFEEEDGEKEEVIFQSWHTHSPAEHSIDGWYPRAELHLVHYDKQGVPRAVVGFLIERHSHASSSAFFDQMPAFKSINFRDDVTLPNVTCNLNHALEAVNGYRDFYTYKGSLTTPPCKQGLRWYIAKDVIYISDRQMQELLDVSTFSARPVQRVWQHAVNE